VGKKVKVVFDTNVWVSILTKGILGEEFSRAKHAITVYFSEEIVLEISKVLLYPKILKTLGRAGESPKEGLRLIHDNSKMVKPRVELNVLEDDPDYNKILECAVAAGADFIVSGDKHLFELGKFKKIRILAPKEFFEQIT
jgi:uncharacterized protein